jgi:fumarate hydratase subunit beta
MKKLILPEEIAELKKLKAGEEVLLTGTIYTARDQAHKRLCAALAKAQKLPFDLKGKVFYYCGPTKTPKGKIIGSCGPTTSRRMDAYVEPLLKRGLAAMIGKGDRSREVRLALKKYRGVYFLTFAGCGALLSKYIKSSRIAAFPELGPEAIRRLDVKDFPLIVAIDRKGENIFQDR